MMIKRTGLFFIVVMLIACSCKQQKEKPNFLMIAIDDMNNWVGEWGGQAQTPNIDRLAKEGVQFKNAYCVVPACNPSRAALMTGQRPETTGQYTNAGDFRDREGGMERVTIPQYLRNIGYEAVGAGKIFHHPRGEGKTASKLSDSISWSYQWKGQIGTPGGAPYLNPETKEALWHEGELGGLGYKARCFWGPIAQSKEQCGDWQLAEFCANYLQKEHEKPFFLTCGIFRPHNPLLAPQEYFDMYPIDEIEMPDSIEMDMLDIPAIAHSNWSTPLFKKMIEKGEWEKAVQAYLACMTFADACVGHVMESLEKSPYKDNTVVLFWTDHGWQLGHKYRWEKFSLWKQATNAPMIIKLPGQGNSNKTCFSEVSYLDIYPTIVELTGNKAPEYLDGTSLVPLLKKPDMEWDIPAVITYPENNHSVVLNGWNYIKYEDGSEELYNQHEDPTEFYNLADRQEYRDKMDSLAKFIPIAKIKMDDPGFQR